MEKNIEKEKEAAKAWYDNLNKQEKLFVEYLDFAELGIERNENPTEDNNNSYWVVDRSNTWEAQPCENAEDVFEAHPSIIEDSIIDNLAEKLEATLNFGKYGDIIQVKPLVYDSERFYYYEAGYYPVLRKLVLEGEIEPTEELSKFLEDYSWDIDICELVAFHADEVDLEKFV